MCCPWGKLLVSHSQTSGQSLISNPVVRFSMYFITSILYENRKIAI